MNVLIRRLKRLKSDFLIFVVTVGVIVSLISVPTPATEAEPATAPAKAERAVLFYFDGLHPDAMRVNL